MSILASSTKTNSRINNSSDNIPDNPLNNSLSTFTYSNNTLATVRLILPAILGTVVEYYDYALYGYCATFLAQAFFPTDNPTVALMKTFGVFVAGFLAKPIGALIFGRIGDKLGRSIALKISMIGIAIPTTVIGFLPTFETIGYWAPLILLICRILQGLFLSGEYDGVRIFVFESVGKKYPNFANSLTNLAGMLGYYLASLIIASIIQPEFPDHAWRIAFLIGGGLGALVFVYRFTIKESIDFAYYQAQTNALKQYQPIKNKSKNFILDNKLTMLGMFLLFGSVGGGYHFYFTFLGNYLSSTLHLILISKAAAITSHMVLAYTIFGPIAGIVADRFNAAKVFHWAAVILLPLVLLNAWMIYTQTISIMLLILTASVLPFFHAPWFVCLIDQLKINERYRCISLAHSLGSCVFSGSAPLIGLWIWQISGGVGVAPLFYLFFLIILGLLGFYLARYRKNK